MTRKPRFIDLKHRHYSAERIDLTQLCWAFFITSPWYCAGRILLSLATEFRVMRVVMKHCSVSAVFTFSTISQGELQNKNAGT